MINRDMKTLEHTPVYVHRGLVLEWCAHNKNGVMLLVAPTGSGKSTGMRLLCDKYGPVFGKTIMIQPTKMATNAILGGKTIRSFTPYQVLSVFFRTKKIVCDTLIIDEIHSRCVEYETLLWIIRRFFLDKMRVILMSATPHRECLDGIFQAIDVVDIPVASPYPIDIVYHPLQNQFGGWSSYRIFLPLIRQCIEDNPGHDRILVFLCTHEHCDRLAHEMKSFAQKHALTTRALYGGMIEEEFQEWNRFLATTKRFIIFATNVAETSITIPDTSLILDFGLRCLSEHNQIVYKQCTQSNLIQRAGRTGRTCAGKVVRFMSEDEFHSRPFQDNVQFNYDQMVLNMLRHEIQPYTIYPPSVDISSIVSRLRSYKLISPSDTVDQDMSSFVLECPFILKNSCLLYDYLTRLYTSSTGQLDDGSVLYILILAMIDFYESRTNRIYFHSHTLKIPRWCFLQVFIKKFSTDERFYDEVELHLNVFMSCVMSENPLEFSKNYCLNFRTIRKLTKHINNVFSFLKKSALKIVQPDWKRRLVCERTDFFEPHSTSLINHPDTHNIQYDVIHTISTHTHPLMEYVRTVFLRQSIPMLMLNQRKCFTNEFYDFSSCIMSDPQCFGVFIFAYDTARTDFSGDITISPFMFMQFPYHMLVHARTLRESVLSSVRQRLILRKAIKKTKQVFFHCKDDIDNDIAFRPMYWKMLSSIEECMMVLSSPS